MHLPPSPTQPLRIFKAPHELIPSSSSPMWPTSLHQRKHQSSPFPRPFVPRFLCNGRAPLLRLALLFLLLLFLLTQFPGTSVNVREARWEDYTVEQAAAFVGRRNGTVILCTVSLPFVSFLNNWLISLARQGRADQVLVVAEDYDTLYKVNERWPGHAVLIPPAVDLRAAHTFGTQGFFNFTSRRPRHMLQILELGYNVMYSDVDLVWYADPFPYFKGNQDIYIVDDTWQAKPLNHSHALPTPKKNETMNMCTCMLFLHPTNGSKRVMQEWIKEIKAQPHASGNQEAFNRALIKTVDQTDVYVLPQVAFPSGAVYFGNKKWAERTEGKHVYIHNNYIKGYDNKKRRFQAFGLWLADEYANESPLGRI